MTTKLARKPAILRGNDGVTNYQPPVELTEATWQRLEALIRQVVQECARDGTLAYAFTPPSVLPSRVVETPSLREANKAVPPVEEEKPMQEQPKPEEHKPRARRTYGAYVQEVNEKGDWVTIS